MDATIKELLNDVVESMKKIYGDNLEKVILFGSYARGSQDNESDVDIAVLVNLNDADIRKYRDNVLTALVDLDAKYDKLTSVIDLSYNHFLHWVNVVPFYKNISEGIVLYERRSC